MITRAFVGLTADEELSTALMDRDIDPGVEGGLREAEVVVGLMLARGNAGAT